MMKNKSTVTRLALSVALSTVLGTTAVLSGCTLSDKQPVSEAESVQHVSAFVDVESLFSTSEKKSIAMSKDGQWIAFLKMHNGAHNLFVVAVDKPDAKPEPVTNLIDSVDSFIWSANRNEILFSKDHQGNENSQIYKMALNSTDLTASTMTRLTHNDEVDYMLLGQSEQDANILAVAANHVTPERIDYFHLTVDKGELTQTQTNSVSLFETQLNKSGQVALGLALNADNSRSMYTFTDGRWLKVMTTEPGEILEIISFDEQTNTAFIAGSIEGRDKQELIKVDLATKSTETVHLDPQQSSDLHHVVFDEQGQPLIVSYYGGKLRNYPLTDSAAKALQQIQSRFSQDIELKVDKINHKEDQWLLTVSFADRPDQKYAYYPTQDKLTGLLNEAPGFDPELLGDRKSITYTASDGVEIQAYLTLPKNLKKNLPTIVLPHGGPWARDQWGYSSGYFVPVAHYFANRGYAVLQPNFRGSLGFGKHFIQLGEKNWGTGTMQHDLTDGVNYLIEQGIADKQRVGIMGASYGGYAALAGATFTPDVYKAVISYVGPSSLVTLMESFPAHYRPYLGTWYVSVGDPEIAKDRADMESRSPINFVDQIKAPLMLVQGANDPRVTQVESDNIARALAAKNHPLEYILAKDEGHGFMKQNNKLASIVAMERFFAKHLGGGTSNTVNPDISAHLDTLRVDVNQL
ncbi:S9 family peptidase [Pseudoalteromonas sp. McH1-42]|uniref:S9 family peptidase n=1 Tax=Pseudoalteromonas sp. McH1-42 TaxID=2917752 RepID=UPI001EF51FE7|nr:S9 family peptidase [Pseudoalteromonas sp. McH1-42]MCG7562974.1 prolyl oligopeptidase family serine peptidase [Pseudoalteromonas sp. McH1-42]